MYSKHDLRDYKVVDEEVGGIAASIPILKVYFQTNNEIIQKLEKDNNYYLSIKNYNNNGRRYHLNVITDKGLEFIENAKKLLQDIIISEKSISVFTNTLLENDLSEINKVYSLTDLTDTIKKGIFCPPKPWKDVFCNKKNTYRTIFNYLRCRIISELAHIYFETLEKIYSDDSSYVSLTIIKIINYIENVINTTDKDSMEFKIFNCVFNNKLTIMNELKIKHNNHVKFTQTPSIILNFQRNLKDSTTKSIEEEEDNVSVESYQEDQEESEEEINNYYDIEELREKLELMDMEKHSSPKDLLERLTNISTKKLETPRFVFDITHMFILIKGASHEIGLTRILHLRSVYQSKKEKFAPFLNQHLKYIIIPFYLPKNLISDYPKNHFAVFLYFVSSHTLYVYDYSNQLNEINLQTPSSRVNQEILAPINGILTSFIKSNVGFPPTIRKVNLAHPKFDNMSSVLPLCLTYHLTMGVNCEGFNFANNLGNYLNEIINIISESI